jgi:hypothetical protein
VKHFDLGQTIRDRYATFGLVKLSGVFGTEDMARLWQEIQDFTGVRSEDFAGVMQGTQKPYNSPGTLMRNRQFWPLLQNTVINDAVRFLVGPEVKFLGLDSLAVHWSSHGMHRDTHVDVTPFMTGEAPADIPYSVTRVLTHVNDPDAEPYMFQFYPASHNVALPEVNVQGRTLHDASQICVAMPVNPGDSLIFDARLLHTGIPIISPKCFITMTYGLPNLYSYDHFFYSRYIRVDQGLTDMEPELVDQMRSEGLYLEGSTDENLRAEFNAPYGHLEGTFDPDLLSRDYIRDI